MPLDVVASYRAKAYCDYLYENEILPTLLTHRWERDDHENWKTHQANDHIIYEKNKTHNIIRLPRPLEKGVTSSLNTLRHWLIGNFEIHLLNSSKIFKNFLVDHLKSNKYDCILAIFSPHCHLKLAYEVHQIFKIPYVLDFRDLWNNQVITKSYTPDFKTIIQDSLIKFFWNKWLNKSLFFSTTSDKWIDYLNKLSGVQGTKVTNGHEIEDIQRAKRTKKFRLAYFGRIYPYQDLDVLIEAINQFLSKNLEINNFELVLIGIKKVNDFDGARVFKAKINNKFITVMEYMSKDKLIEFAESNVSLFILPNLKEDNGSFFVKLYDYIALNKPIILAPANGSENDNVVNKLNAGIVTSSVDEIVNFIQEKYRDYNKNGFIPFTLEKEGVEEYHRANQVKSLANQLIVTLK
jgi:glycosyltransferase involved in cell wall biosynthesis